MFKPNITTEEINALPRVFFDKEIILVETMDDAFAASVYLSSQTILGFDTETKPSFKKGASNRHGVALLQLSTSDRAFLFRLNKMALPECIISILANKAIIKAGVAIKEDIRILQKLRNFKAEGFVELQDLVKKYGIENYSLKKMAAIVLNFNISKSQRLTDWEALELTHSQQIYAATDAWICFSIYKALMAEKTEFSSENQPAQVQSAGKDFLQLS